MQPNCSAIRTVSSELAPSPMMTSEKFSTERSAASSVRAEFLVSMLTEQRTRAVTATSPALTSGSPPDRRSQQQPPSAGAPRNAPDDSTSHDDPPSSARLRAEHR